MIKKKFDFFVIGVDQVGVRAARVASKGMKVGLAEGWDLGGTCVNRGCVPKKLYSYSSHFSDEFQFDEFIWMEIISNQSFLGKNWWLIKKEIKRLSSIYKNLLMNSGVNYLMILLLLRIKIH